MNDGQWLISAGSYFVYVREEYLLEKLEEQETYGVQVFFEVLIDRLKEKGNPTNL